MNKTPQPQRSRSFLIERLPEPLISNSSHLQIIDRYLAGTNIRTRRIRDPRSNDLNYFLQKITTASRAETLLARIEEIHLNEREGEIFGDLTGRETRKNRYFHDFDGKMMIFDVYLGSLSGLTIARVDFRDEDEMLVFEPPPFAIYEITNDEFFTSLSLADKDRESVALEVDRLGRLSPDLHAASDE